jgi:glycosyltransferase involved in cell wall biosynthesis
MNILIDAHMVGERETGNETYIVNLIRGLQRLETPHRYFLASAHPDALAEQVLLNDQFSMVEVSASPVRRLLFDLPTCARACRADVLHVTYMGPPRCPVPMVVSIHDVAYRSHPEWFSLRDRMVLRGGIRSTIHRACRVITISHHAKSEILKHFQLPADKVTVTHLAAGTHYHASSDPRAMDQKLKQLGVPSPYVLATGNLQPRKNLVRLVEAFARAKKESSLPHHLVLCGKAQWRESEVHATISRCNAELFVHFTGYVSDEDLRVLFQGADVFAYPSLYEGFGLPILEAMACGAPVLTSNTTSMPEVAGDAAVLIDPCSVEDITGGLKQMFLDKKLCDVLRRKGLAQAAKFTWEKTAQDTVRIYETVKK